MTLTFCFIIGVLTQNQKGNYKYRYGRNLGVGGERKKKDKMSGSMEKGLE